MKKSAKKDERKRPASWKNSSSKPSNSQSSSAGQSSAPRRLKNKLYICGLLPTVLREELIREFGKYGKLHDVWVAKKPPGFAFVEYVNSRDAERVVHELDDAKVLGSKVRIEFAKANKGLEEPKKTKKFFPPSSSGSKTASSTKPYITPLMGQLVVPSLLTASLGSSLSLLGSPPLSGLALSGASRASKKRYRGDSGGRWEQSLSRKAISPLIRRFSRSPVGRGRMLSPPPRRPLAMPRSPSFPRLSRGGQKSVLPLLPPPPSRDMNSSPVSKFQRLPSMVMNRISRSPLRTKSGSLRRMRRSLSRTRIRSPMRNWGRLSPRRIGRADEDKPRGSTSPVRNRSWSHHRRRSLSRGRDRSASLEKNFVKSQVRTMRGSRRSCSASSRDEERHRRESVGKELANRNSFKKGSWNKSPSVGRGLKHKRSMSSNSKSISGSPGNYGRELMGRSRRSRGSSKSSTASACDMESRRKSISRENTSMDRKASQSSNRRESLSLRRNFYRSPDRGYSRDRSTPLNFVRTRLLGRTPPSPPARTSKSSEKGEKHEIGTKSRSLSPTKSGQNERRSRSKSYKSKRSLSGSPKNSTRRSKESKSRSYASPMEIHVNPRMKKRGKDDSVSSSSRSSSRSSSSSRAPQENVRKVRSSVSKSPGRYKEDNNSSRGAEKPRLTKNSRQDVKKSPEMPMRGKTHKRRSGSAHSSAVIKKKPCPRPRGGPRSPSGSPGMRSHDRYGRVPLPREISKQKMSSRSRDSNSRSSGACDSRRASTERKTPLAYQHRRESLSPPPPSRKKEFVCSKSPLGGPPPRPFSPRRPRTKMHVDRRSRDMSKYNHRGITPPHHLEPERFKKDFRHSPSYHNHHRSRYYRSPPLPLPMVHHYDEMAARMDRHRVPYYDEHRVEPRPPGYYRRSEFLEPDKGFYRRPSPPTHLPPPPQTSYPYRRVPEMEYQRSSSRIRCEDVDPYYRSLDPFRGKIRNHPIMYRSGTNSEYPRQRPYRR